MKSQFLRDLVTAPKLRKMDFVWTLLPALIWYLGVHSRDHVIHPRCMEAPATCQTSQLPAVDRPAVGLENSDADYYSLITQNLSGIIAVSTPPVWNTALFLSGRLSPQGALIATVVDMTLFLQTTVINGAMMEVTRITAQRPRPYVYADPRRGGDASNYTSFYSGHTSFAAAATMFLFFTLLSREAPTFILIVCAGFGQALVLLTALFRVLAGRHFPSDVLVAAFIGCLVALGVAHFHRSPPRKS